jgi:SAM-dependent methyltransferase
VSGIDLNGPMVDVAILLTGRAGLADRVRHVAGDATRLPFEPEGFDFAWTQHVAMNIADRRALYVGVRAMLRPGGRFAMHDVVAGEGGPLHFPVPWARDPAASFVITAEATREALESAGLVVRDWIDATDAALEWFAAQPTAAGNRPDHLKPLALPLIIGPGFPTMTANLARNVREGRARFLQAVVERPV